jgi:hypothetical protein
MRLETGPVSALAGEDVAVCFVLPLALGRGDERLVHFERGGEMVRDLRRHYAGRERWW